MEQNSSSVNTTNALAPEDLPKTTQSSDNKQGQKKNKEKLYLSILLVLVTILVFTVAISSYLFISNRKIVNDYNELKDEMAQNNQAQSSCLETTNSEAEKDSLVLSSISADIEPYRQDIKDDKLVHIFRVKAVSKDGDIDTVTYWTDKESPCDAKTVNYSDLSELVEVYEEVEKFVFFTFKDTQGNSSEIYVMSSSPIFQCGKLAE